MKFRSEPQARKKKKRRKKKRENHWSTWFKWNRTQPTDGPALLYTQSKPKSIYQVDCIIFNVLNLYLGGVQFESQLGHLLPWLRSCVAFLRPSKQITCQNLNLAMTTSFKNSFNFHQPFYHLILYGLRECWHCKTASPTNTNTLTKYISAPKAIYFWLRLWSSGCDTVYVHKYQYFRWWRQLVPATLVPAYIPTSMHHIQKTVTSILTTVCENLRFMTGFFLWMLLILLSTLFLQKDIPTYMLWQRDKREKKAQKRQPPHAAISSEQNIMQ
jgi:hypothetical protein